MMAAKFVIVLIIKEIPFKKLLFQTQSLIKECMILQ